MESFLLEQLIRARLNGRLLVNHFAGNSTNSLMRFGLVTVGLLACLIGFSTVLKAVEVLSISSLLLFIFAIS